MKKLAALMLAAMLTTGLLCGCATKDNGIIDGKTPVTDNDGIIGNDTTNNGTTTKKSVTGSVTPGGSGALNDNEIVDGNATAK